MSSNIYGKLAAALGTRYLRFQLQWLCFQPQWLSFKQNGFVLNFILAGLLISPESKSSSQYAFLVRFGSLA